jgi:hypothetical protein
MMVLIGQWLLWVYRVLDDLGFNRLWIRFGVLIFLNLTILDERANWNMILSHTLEQHSLFHRANMSLLAAMIIFIFLSLGQVFVAQTLGLVQVFLRNFRNRIVGNILLFCEFFESHLFPEHLDLALLCLFCGLRHNRRLLNWLLGRSSKDWLSVAEMTGLALCLGLLLWLSNLGYLCLL